MRVVVAIGLLVLASACYRSHHSDPPTRLPDAAADDSGGRSTECVDEVYSRGECNACSRSTTWLRRCADHAYTDGFFRAVFNLDGCDGLTLVSCAMWQLETDTYACVPPDLCGDLDVTSLEDLVFSGPGDPAHGRFRPVPADSDPELTEPPSCEEMIASAPDC